jgi:hypothetical protein
LKLIVYVEGPSDKYAMEAHLSTLIDYKGQQGVAVEFIHPVRKGDAKEYLVTQAPKLAARIVVNDPYAVVAIVPDLYPRNKGFTHETCTELDAGMQSVFEKELERLGRLDDARLRDRFKVFCFKHDLEALILASEQVLAQHLRADTLEVNWTIPVENQNHELPPKRIVERLFRLHDRDYKGVLDAPLILGRTSPAVTTERCPQCFRPFVEFIEQAVAIQ